MTRKEAIRILDEVIPPPEHHTVDLDHLRIAQAWLCIKETLTDESVKHGRWIKHKDRACWYCSECVTDDYYAYSHNCDTGVYELQDKFCPNCGVRMDEVPE